MLIFLITPAGAFSQVTEEDLIGTWFPVMELDEKGDTTFFVSTPNLLAFHPNGEGKAEFPGERTKEYPFSYKVFTDSIYAETQNNSLFFQAIKPHKDRLTLIFSKEQTISFVRLPEYSYSKNLEALEETLSGGTWEFPLPDYERKDLLLFQYELSHLKDSSRTHRTPWNKAYSSLRPYDDDRNKVDGLLWSVSQHKNTFVLHIDFGWDIDKYQTFLVKRFDNKSMTVDFWREGIRYEVNVKKLPQPTIKQIAKKVRKLTRFKWRFESEKVPKTYDSLDIRNWDRTHDYFEELPPYNNDSTLLIKQSDLDQNLLILEFSNDSTYTVYREERVLDTGSWRFIFDDKRLVLQSSKDSGLSDGVFGGYVFIDKVRRNTLKISRDFLHNQSRSYWNNFSYPETYKPYRKRN